MSLQTMPTFQRLPEYLKSYVVDQNYGSYTAREQATWRFIMRNARPWFQKHAHEVYMDGLRKTGIPIGKIPNVEEMDRVLNAFGWGALCVRGFIPPLAFLEFQSLKILPIAADMRTIGHIAYTPAPDIVHEAAGHAPILADPGYTRYLERYAHLARKAIFSAQDIRLYEAIRVLSDVKENPDSKFDVIQKAEKGVEDAVGAISWVSEAARVARMNWWTAEYGLVGDMKHPKIYGAGLLSSLGEGRTCLEDEVKKIPLSIDCINQSYDITRPQPQLYVAKDFEHLVEVLAELEETMAFRRGGTEGLETAKKAGTLTSVVFDSEVTVSGVLQEVRICEKGRVSFLKWSGPVQLAREEAQLPGHGRDRHPGGFSSPVGEWQAFPGKDPCALTEKDLTSVGLCKGEVCHLKFSAGFEVRGLVKDLLFKEGRLCLITWDQCQVQKGAETLFSPDWGEFDMLVGRMVTSVYGGPADWANYGAYDFGKASTSPGRSTPYTTEEKRLFSMYQQVRDLRESGTDRDRLQMTRDLSELAAELCRDFPEEWLLALEIVEIVHQRLGEEEKNMGWVRVLLDTTLSAGRLKPETSEFVERGLQLAAIPD